MGIRRHEIGYFASLASRAYSGCREVQPKELSVTNHHVSSVAAQLSHHPDEWEFFA